MDKKKYKSITWHVKLNHFIETDWNYNCCQYIHSNGMQCNRQCCDDVINLEYSNIYCRKHYKFVKLLLKNE